MPTMWSPGGGESVEKAGAAKARTSLFPIGPLSITLPAHPPFAPQLAARSARLAEEEAPPPPPDQPANDTVVALYREGDRFQCMLGTAPSARARSPHVVFCKFDAARRAFEDEAHAYVIVPDPFDPRVAPVALSISHKLQYYKTLRLLMTIKRAVPIGGSIQQHHQQRVMYACIPETLFPLLETLVNDTEAGYNGRTSVTAEPAMHARATSTTSPPPNASATPATPAHSPCLACWSTCLASGGIWLRRRRWPTRAAWRGLG